MNKRIFSSKGFTIIELMVVLAIIAVLAMAYMPSLARQSKKELVALDAKDALYFAQGMHSYISHNFRKFIKEDEGEILHEEGVALLTDKACKQKLDGAIPYLRCEFKNKTRLGLGFDTKITKEFDIDSSEVPVIRAHINLGTILDEKNKPDLSMMSVFAQKVNVPHKRDMKTRDYIQAVVVKEKNDKAHLELIIESAQTVDDFLRADGSVQATGNFEWGNKDIANIRHLSINNDVCLIRGEGDKGQWQSDMMTNTQTIHQGDKVKMPKCHGFGSDSTGESQPQIHVTTSAIVYGDEIKKPIQATKPVVTTDEETSEWQVRYQVLVNGEWITPVDGAKYLPIIALTSCAAPKGYEGCKAELEALHEKELDDE